MSQYFKLIDTEILDEKIHSKIFPFSQYLFWDAAIENIDIQKNKTYIIERVLTRGFLEDFYLLTKIYSRIEIEEALLKSKVLDAKTVHFCSWYFNIQKNKLNASAFYN